MMKVLTTWFLGGLLLSSTWAYGQNRAQLIKEADSTYKSNILKSRINGVYIPKDLDDAFAELDRLSPPEALDKIRVEDETFIAQKLHYGLGRWMAYNWNFDEGSRFSHYLKGLGLFYSSEMIDFLLISYHRYLNKKPQDIEVRVKQYIEKRKKKS
ncbi:MAG: hypothetical protein IPK46_00870 [Saprospiraceae bacterium]|nr:hypothetical protein [Saprospiraceae bacterium]